MATYTSKSEVKTALQEARQNLKITRRTGEKDKEAYWMKECKNLQFILDNWSK